MTMDKRGGRWRGKGEEVRSQGEVKEGNERGRRGGRKGERERERERKRGERKAKHALIMWFDKDFNSMREREREKKKKFKF